MEDFLPFHKECKGSGRVSKPWMKSDKKTEISVLPAWRGRISTTNYPRSLRLKQVTSLSSFFLWDSLSLFLSGRNRLESLISGPGPLINKAAFRSVRCCLPDRLRRLVGASRLFCRFCLLHWQIGPEWEKEQWMTQMAWLRRTFN